MRPILIPALFAAALSLGACSSGPSGDAAPVPRVSVETRVLEPVEVPSAREWDGRIEAIDRATLAAQTSGRVADIPVDVGDVVELRLTALALRGLDAASVGGHVVGTGDDDIPLKGSLPTPPTVVQSTGTSQEDVMSQYAVTAMFDKAALTNLTAADAGKIVMVNAAGDGFVLGPKISTDDVANTVAVRDANGSITANDIISTGESS